MIYDLQTGRMLLRRKRVGKMIIGQMYASHKDAIQALEPFKRLEKRLLEVGGREMVFTPVEPELLIAILERGRTFDASGAKRYTGPSFLDRWIR